MTPSSQPTSPHIQIYRWQWTSICSILHRITGVLLAKAMLIITLWIAGLASPGWLSSAMSWFLGSWPGVISLALILWATVFHLLNGLRHLAWDLGYGFDPSLARISAYAVLTGTTVFTVLLIVIGALR